MITSNQRYMHEDIEGPGPSTRETQHPDRLLTELQVSLTRKLDNKLYRQSCMQRIRDEAVW
jgi:hypothetical protein